MTDTIETMAELTPELVSDAHLFLETPFSEYTVSEGLFLLILLAGFLWLIIWFFKGGF